MKNIYVAQPYLSPLEEFIPYLEQIWDFKVYRYIGQGDEPTFANSSDQTLLSLPVGEHLRIADAQEVVICVKEFLEFDT